MDSWKNWLAAAASAVLVASFAFPPSSVSAADGPTQGISSSKVIKLGAWLPRSGPLSGIGTSGMDGALVAFDELNRAGGVNGYTVKMIEIDDGYEPGRSVAAVRQLWLQDKVFAVFHPYGSPAAAATAKFVIENNIPLLFPFANAEIFHGESAKKAENVYSFYPFYDQLVYLVTSFAAEKLGRKKIGVAYHHGEFGEAGYRAIKTAAQRYGFELGLETGYAPNETNFVAIGRRIAAANNDATLVWSVIGGPQIVAAAEQAGYKGDWLIQTGMTGDAAIAEYKRIPSLANRIYLPHFQRLPNDPSPEIQDFVKKIKVEKRDADVDVAIFGYTNAKVFIEALSRATKDGSGLTWPKFKTALESIDNADIVASTHLSYANGNRIGNTYGRIYKWDGGDWRVESDFKPLPPR